MWESALYALHPFGQTAHEINDAAEAEIGGNWELITVPPDTPWEQDDSGYHVLVHRIAWTETHKERAGERVQIRVDVFASDNEPLISFVGPADSVRKTLTRWFPRPISAEHAAYIGAEIERANLDPMYIQS